MYKIVPAERQGRSKEAITKNRCKPSKNGLQRSFLAPPARLELTTFRLGVALIRCSSVAVKRGKTLILLDFTVVALLVMYGFFLLIFIVFCGRN